MAALAEPLPTYKKGNKVYRCGFIIESKTDRDDDQSSVIVFRKRTKKRPELKITIKRPGRLSTDDLKDYVYVTDLNGDDGGFVSVKAFRELYMPAVV